MVKKRKSRVASPPLECTLHDCMSLIAGAWTSELIWYLSEGSRSFSELASDLKGVSAKVLTAKLRRLEHEKILLRTTRPTSPPTVWYELTPLGVELHQAMIGVMNVGRKLKLARTQS